VAPLPSRIPLFPLPDVVLFPHVSLPLHIFEPRYRKMVADALAGERTIGMILLRPGWEADYYGRPPVFESGCAGRIETCQELEGGKYNIVLRALSRLMASSIRSIDSHCRSPNRTSAMRQSRPTRVNRKAVSICASTITFSPAAPGFMLLILI